MKFREPKINVIIILITLKVIYDSFFAFLDFTNVIMEKTRWVGIMLKRADIKANIEAVLSNIEYFQKISNVTIEVNQTTHEIEQNQM